MFTEKRLTLEQLKTVKLGTKLIEWSLNLDDGRTPAQEVVVVDEDFHAKWGLNEFEADGTPIDDCSDAGEWSADGLLYLEDIDVFTLFCPVE